MTAEQIEAKLDQDLTVVSSRLLYSFLFGIAAVLARYAVLLFSGGTTMSSWHLSGLAFVSTIWALAWFAGGFLFGFLFGIPKVAQREQAAAGSGSPTPTLKVNTNLEDISDWLTKILVGATLTQLVKIPGAVKTAAWFMARGDATASAESFNAAILYYFFVLGILAGYVLTRMFFAVAFARADSAPDRFSEILDSLGGASVSIGGSKPANAAEQSAAVASQNIPLTKSLTAPQAVALAFGARLAGDGDRALQAATLALQQKPDDPAAQFAYGLALETIGASTQRQLAAIQTAADKTTASTDSNLLESIYASLTYLSLYLKPPDSYTRTLQAAAEYDQKKGPPSAAIEINRACAYGQKARALRSSEAAPTEFNAARDAALAAVQKAIRLEPSAATRLAELLWVTADPRDNDLAVFQGDSDFEKLLPRPEAT